MLKVQPSKKYLEPFLQERHEKQGEHFLVPLDNLKIVEELLEEIMFIDCRHFSNQMQQISRLIQHLIHCLIRQSISLPHVEKIFEALKGYEDQQKKYQAYYSQLDEFFGLSDSGFKPLSPALSQNSPLTNNCKGEESETGSFHFDINPIESCQNFFNNGSCLSPKDNSLRISKSLVYDIETFSEETRKTSLYPHQYSYCNEYLTTSEDQREAGTLPHKDKLQKLLELSQKKELKIEPKVSTFHYTNSPAKRESQQLSLGWEKIKPNILNLPKVKGRVDHKDSLMEEQIKSTQYRQKVRSVLMKKRLTTKLNL